MNYNNLVFLKYNNGSSTMNLPCKIALTTFAHG